MKETSKVPVKARSEMMMPRSWSPFALLDELRTEMEQRWGRPWVFRTEEPLPTLWQPSVDMFEKEGDLIVHADLPGLKKEEVEVTLEGGDLILKGERKEQSEVKEGSFFRCERTYGSFLRRMALPYEVDPDKVVAKFTDGVLEVTMPIPKTELAKSRKIAVT